VILLDAYAVLSYLKGEPAADEVRTLLETRRGMLTTVGLAEVLDHLVRIVGVDEDDAVLDVAQLDLLDPPDLDAATATASGLLRARNYHRSRCAVSLADCVAAETARRRGLPLVTSDPQLLDVCHREGIGHHVLPDSTGVRWSPVR
jgi:predicted nucleic acid-binding protein